MMTGADPLVVNLSPFFTDADDDELTFSDPVSSNPAAATVELSDSTLTIHGGRQWHLIGLHVDHLNLGWSATRSGRHGNRRRWESVG